MTLHRHTAWPIVPILAIVPLWIACSSDLANLGAGGTKADTSSGGSDSASGGDSSSTSGSGGKTSSGAGGGKATGGSSSGSGGSSGSSKGGASGTGGSSGSGGTTDADGPVLGGFTVTLKAAVAATESEDAQAAYTTFQGSVYAAEYPSIRWETVLEADGCKVLKKLAASCDPECGGSALCVTDNNCVTYPSALDVGKLTVDGLGQTFTATKVMSSYSTGASLAYPPCDQGASVKANAAGTSSLEAFELQVKCISPLEVTTEQFDMKDATPLALKWTPPPSGSPSTMKVLLDISHHGGGTAQVVCEVDDDGSFDIPATVVDKLMSYGKAGMPYVLFTRTAIGSTKLPAGRVEMRMMAPIERPLTVPGVISCNPPSLPCPDGMDCQPDFSCK